MKRVPPGHSETGPAREAGADPDPAAAAGPDAGLLAAFASHPRNWRANRYVYPVCSRRSGGISVGVNLNPDKVCNFDCVYCQVDRTSPGGGRDVDLAVLAGELDDMIGRAASGRLFDEPEFAPLPADLRAFRDVAFSGDGEPTTCPQFAGAVELAAARLDAAGLDGVRLVVITNATMFHRPEVRRAIERLHRGGRGEVWAKLDAGSEDYYRRVDRSAVPLRRVMENVIWSAEHWPIVIQSCFVRLAGQGPQASEVAAFCDRLGEVLAVGAIRLVQVYTIARPPAESFVAPLTRSEVDAIVASVRRRFPALPVAPFYGP